MGLYLPHARISSHFGLSHAGRSTTAAVFTHPALVSSALSRLGIELHRTILLLACARWHRPSHTARLCREVFRASTRSVLVSTHLNSLRHRIFFHLATERMEHDIAPYSAWLLFGRLSIRATRGMGREFIFHFGYHHSSE